MFIDRLTSRYKRRAIAAPNFTFYAWKFVANAVPTYHAMRMRQTVQHQDTVATLLEQGIVVADTSQFLSDAGQAAMADASAAILATANSDHVRNVNAGSELKGGKKDFLVNLVKFEKGVPPDAPLLKVALDPKLLEIVASYLCLWPTLHSIASWLNYPTDQPPAVSDRKSTRLNSSHVSESRMPSSA